MCLWEVWFDVFWRRKFFPISKLNNGKLNGFNWIKGIFIRGRDPCFTLQFWGILLSYHIWIKLRKVIFVQLKYRIINKQEQNFKSHHEIAFSVNGTRMWKHGICSFHTVFQELAYTDCKLLNKTESCPPNSMETCYFKILSV